MLGARGVCLEHNNYKSQAHHGERPSDKGVEREDRGLMVQPHLTPYRHNQPTNTYLYSTRLTTTHHKQ